MADHSDIEWTDATWNPITGCSIKSPGCAHCYAMTLAGTRLKNHPSRKGLTQESKAGPVWTGEVRFNEQWLGQPLAWARPRNIFVCAHGDLFHEGVPDAWLDPIFAVMALSPQHTFQVLTKRAQRMREYIVKTSRHTINGHIWAMRGMEAELTTWPLPNVWLGVSAERQQEWDERKQHLCRTPAAVRFASFEPLLGGIIELDPISDYLQWAIVGGESGLNARPMHPDWARYLRDACMKAGVPFFFKQWGEWAPSTPEEALGNPRSGWQVNAAHPHVAKPSELYPEAGARFVARVGKKAAGRLLDGIEHNGMPTRSAA